jgi:tol-pal system protein YbgF
MARLRGSDEQITRDVADLQRRQKDMGQGVDDRLRKLEPVKVSIDGREFMADPDEKRRPSRTGWAAARLATSTRPPLSLAAFLRRYPSQRLRRFGAFLAGQCAVRKRDYKEAIATFRAFVTASPEHPRAPEALLALANSQAEMKDTKGARKTLDDLIKAYPKSEAAQAGKERLAS